MERPDGAGPDAVAAADALEAVRVFPDPDVHFAGLLAEAAVDALVLFDLEAVERELVERGIDRAERPYLIHIM